MDSVTKFESSGDFLFTWKPEKWPYEHLRALIDDFETDQTVVQHWRCTAHRMVRPGSRAYLFKQGASPRGVFGVGEVIGPPRERDDVKEGEARYEVPLRFEVLLDPKRRFLVSESDLANLPASPSKWNAQGSGVPLDSETARIIDNIVNGQRPEASGGVSSPARQERVVEVYQRDQTLVDELKRLYKGHCQICKAAPFDGQFGEIAEGHHIQWLCRGGNDSLDNLMLLCPNHHAAVHAADPTFDRVKLEFRFGPKPVPVRFDLHLKPT